MLLRIQSEESLRSYVERNIYLNWKEPPVKVFEKLSRFYMRDSSVKTIASVMGWTGCYGFNRLLHLHTNYPQQSIFKNIQDMAYSGYRFLDSPSAYETEETRAAFCPECIKSDLKNLGFSYWRRSHRYLNVCAKHNVKLERNCPFCQRELFYHGEAYGHDAMWETCKGLHLSDCVATLNYDLDELKKSKLYEDISSCKFHISEESALTALHKKTECLVSEGLLYGDGVVLFVDELRSAVETLADARLKNDWRYLGDFNKLIFRSILIVYDDFTQFEADIRLHSHELRDVYSLMSTYRNGYSETVNYVEVVED